MARSHNINILYSCDICDKSFTTNKALRSHLPTHQVKDPQSLVCDVCDKTFTAKNSLYRHIRNVHKGKSIKGHRYHCDQCGKIYFSYAALGRHRSRIHRDRVVSSAANKIDAKLPTMVNLTSQQNHVAPGNNNEDELMSTS